MSITKNTDKITGSENKFIIHRKRLFTLLDENKEKNLILVQSPAGYGKTTLVMDFLSKANIHASWINSTVEMNHLYSFINNFVHAFKLLNPGFGNNTLQLLESRRERLQLSKNERASAIELCHTFINDFQKHFENNVYIVIDDFHNLEESVWLKTFFDKLFEIIPSNLHLIVVSRQIPDFDFIRLSIDGKILRINTEDLVFKADDISKLLTDVYSILPGEVNTRILEENIGGWITGIHMLIQTYGKNFDKLEIHSQKIPENIFNFLAEEHSKALITKASHFC
jgi:LuxR family transcriptional regulator, maltose regulon positive regulatory protein